MNVQEFYPAGLLKVVNAFRAFLLEVSWLFLCFKQLLVSCESVTGRILDVQLSV